MIRVVGLQLGLDPRQIAEIVQGFRAGVVPIVARHRHGVCLGYLSAVGSEGSALVFAGVIAEYADEVARLSGGLPCSVEIIHHDSSLPRSPSFAEQAMRESSGWRYLRGVPPGDGWRLVGVALSDSPRAPGSALWAA